MRPPPDPGQPNEEQIRFRRALGGAMRREWVTHALIAVNVAIFLWMGIRGVDPISPSGQALLEWGANYTPLTRNGQWWRLFTSMFVHAGLMHIGFNMYALLAFGRTVERIFGHAGYALLYLLAGLAGSAASALVPPFGPSIGASGAIFGVIGALIAFVVRRRKLLPAQVLKPMRNALFVTVVFNLGFGFSVGGIDNAAHLGGLVGGLLAGLVLVPSLDGERLRWPRALYPAVALACVAVIGVVGFTSFLR